MRENSHYSLDSTGKFSDLLRLFFPILLMTFSNCIFLLVEKVMVARISTQAMEAAVNVAYACLIFQGPCIALAMMAQVWVGRWFGGKELKAIGPGIWQFIWFSFLSMLITFPCSLLYGHFYFRGTAIEAIALPYFYFLISINFLYPLGAALTCFYVGQRKTSLVLFATIGSQLLKLGLAFILIFGWGAIPSLGLMGGALSTFIAQGIYCLLLFVLFLKAKQAETYHSRYWHFKPRLFWEYISPGLLRAMNRILNFTCWAAIAHLMTLKGGDYLLVLSIGGTLNLFLPFLGDAVGQAHTTIVSNILGSQRYSLLSKAFRSGVLLVSCVLAVVSAPLLLFPSATFHFLFPTIAMGDPLIRLVLLGVWVSFAFFTFTYLPISYILAFKDMKFSLFMGCFSWLNGYLFMYIAIVVVEIPADLFWLVLSFSHCTTALLYLWRMKWLRSKVIAEEKAGMVLG